MGGPPLPFVVAERWRAEEVLGRGGVSSVYRAVDLQHGGDVALKLGEPWRTESQLWQRFEREASALALIGSDHIVRVLAAGRSPELDAPFLVMERLVGNDLAQEIRQRGALPPVEAIAWFEQAARALELAHGVGIVHRDLKPSNLFLHEPAAGARLLKVLDFGLVKRLEPDAGPIADPDAFAGTPAYMAPEQARGHTARTAPTTDVWAMGMVAIAMLTGGHYWQAGGAQEILRAIRFEPLTPPSHRWPWLPRAFDDWFRRSCDRVAERRFPSVALQAEALRRALGGATQPRPAINRNGWDDRATATFSHGTTVAGSLAREPASLPTVAPLVGRDAECRELFDMLSRREGALVTITGAGGTGKSHLAEAVAGGLQHAFAHGVWHVPLAALRDAALVPDAIAQALALPRDPVLSTADLVAGALGDNRALVVLDSFEHLMPARAVIADLRARCPRVSWLVTSRAPLGLDGEERYALAPLEVPTGPGVGSVEEASQYSAVQLFVERAKVAVPEFALTEANAAEVAEICRRLEGLPLAIELAAARVKSHAAGNIQERLGSRLDVLGPAEHGSTMRATIAWSYDLLAEPERAAFRRLAVCPAALSGAAARTIIGNGVDVGALVAALVDSSLLHYTVDEPPRLAMLETVRAFGLEALIEAGEHQAACERALAHFLDVAEQADLGLRGPEQERWVDELAAEHDNLGAMLAWALDHAPEAALRLASRLSWFWYLRGHYREGRAWLQAALEHAPAAAAPCRARALLGAGELAFLQCDYEPAASLLEESAALSRRLGDARGMAAGEQMLGSIARELGDYALAAARHGRSREAWDQLGDKREVARSVNYLAFVAWLGGGDPAGAAALAEQARAAFAETGDKEGSVWSTLNAGAAAFYQGDVAGAARRFEESFNDAVSVRYQEGMAWSLNMQGLCSLARREWTRARAQLRASLRLHRRIGDLWRSASVLEALAAVAMENGDAPRAAFLLGAARSLRHRIGVPVPAVERPLVEDLQRRLGPESADIAAGERAALEDALALATEEAPWASTAPSAASSV